jgi:hypothetical protein
MGLNLRFAARGHVCRHVWVRVRQRGVVHDSVWVCMSDGERYTLNISWPAALVDDCFRAKGPSGAGIVNALPRDCGDLPPLPPPPTVAALALALALARAAAPAPPKTFFGFLFPLGFRLLAPGPVPLVAPRVVVRSFGPSIRSAFAASSCTTAYEVGKESGTPVANCHISVDTTSGVSERWASISTASYSYSG